MINVQPELQKMWRIFTVAHNTPLSLRALWPKGVAGFGYPVNITFTSAHYPDIECRCRAFEGEALRLNSLGYNIYIVMNTIKESFRGKSVGDADIRHRDLLLIDIDRVEKLTAPATDDEIEAARLVADSIKAFMEERGWSDPIRVMSGNGHHLYYRLQGTPNDEASERMIQSALFTLAQRFDTDIVKVDTVVFNASRITKVPGTIARKGPESKGRPYRMAVLHEA